MDRDDGIDKELQDFVERQRRAGHASGDRAQPGSQHVVGNGNVQVGVANAPVNIGRHDDFDPNNPNIEPCPSCWKPVSRLASPCPRCGYDVAKHHEAALLQIKREKKAKDRSALETVMFCSMGIALAGFWLGGQSWMPDGLAKLLWGVAGIAIVLTGVLAKVLS